MNEVIVKEIRRQGPVNADAQLASLRPAVDVYEDDTGITLYADLPGVAREDLHLQVEKDTLTLDAKVNVDLPENLQQLYAEARTGRYQRSFELADTLDRERIEASLQNGVLALRIPKRQEVLPRRIEVRGA